MKVALFDMDGTIFPSQVDWLKIRTHLQITETSILGSLFGKTDPQSQEKMKYIEAIERENTERVKIRPGTHSLLRFLHIHQVASVLVTNNSETNTHFLLNKYQLTFDLVITRNSGKWKPDPDPFLYAFESLGTGPEDSISIGDSTYDIQASRAAGISRIFIIQSRFLPEDPKVRAFKRFSELQRILADEWLPPMSTCRHISRKTE